MVVGTNAYVDTAEAYPLDKKILRKIVWRSFLMDAGYNAETGSSLGFTWAIAPGLERIHSNKEDLTVALGHSLEFNDCSGLFSTLVMGVVLSNEAVKADPAAIRSVRTALGLACKSLDKQIHVWLILPLVVGACASLLTAGNVIPVVVFAAVYFLLSVILRFVLINVGYAQGSKIAEKVISKQEQYKKACSVLGIFTLGFLTIYSASFYMTLSMRTFSIANSTYSVINAFNSALPGLFGIISAALSYHLLTKKNYSLMKTGVILIVLGFLIGIIL